MDCITVLPLALFVYSVALLFSLAIVLVTERLCPHKKNCLKTTVLLRTRAQAASIFPTFILLYLSPLPSLLPSIGMAAAAVYATQVSAGEYLHPHLLRHALPLLTPISPTLVNDTHLTERPSVKLKISGGSSNIFNSEVVTASGQSLYSISSNSKRTTLVSCKDNVEVATVEWDRSSPRMVYRRKKMKCKEWLPLAGPDTETRLLTHGDERYTWTHRSTSGYLIPANRPGLAVARWRVKTRTDELRLEIFQEALVESGLLEAVVLSIVLIRSGRSLGDSTGLIDLSDPRFVFRQSRMM